MLIETVIHVLIRLLSQSSLMILSMWVWKGGRCLMLILNFNLQSQLQ